MKNRNYGFTLVELLVVVAILGILMVAVVLAINPIEIMKKSRDSTRFSDMDTLRKAIDLAVADEKELTQTVVPGDSSAAGASRATTGSGWVNVDVSQYLSTLPIDPRNGSTFTDAAGNEVTGKYLYASDGSAYELNCYLESEDNKDKYTTDGGDTSGGLTIYEVGTDPGRHHHAPGAHSHPDRVGQRRQEAGQPGLVHPVAQVRRITAVDQQDVGLPDPGHPALRADRGQRRQLQQAQRLPLQRGHRIPRSDTADEAPHGDRAAPWMSPLRGRDAEGDGLVDRPSQHVDEGVADAPVRDAARREEELHARLPVAAAPGR